MKIIDPISLEVVSEAWSIERSSFARMAISPVVNHVGHPEDAIILLGDEFVYQV